MGANGIPGVETARPQIFDSVCRLRMRATLNRWVMSEANNVVLTSSADREELQSTANHSVSQLSSLAETCPIIVPV